MLRPGKTNNGLPTSNYGAGTGGSYSGSYGGSYGQGGGQQGGSYGGYSSSSYGVSSGGAYDTYPPPTASPRHGVPKKKGKSYSIADLLTDKFVWAALVAFLFMGTTLYYRGQSSSILSKLEAKSIDQAIGSFEKIEREKTRLEKEALSTNDAQRKFKDTIRNLEMENRELRKSKDELRIKYETDAGGGKINTEDETKLKAREEAWRKQVYVLQNATSRESAREARARFGPGPHRVRFHVRLPNDPVEGEFIAEMAGLDVMPHAVHLFLEQVHHRLWDNTFFYLNGPHVLQAGPQDWDEDTVKGDSLQRFKDMQLDKLAFPEYNSTFPHLPWTMGYTGRPGGPDWYINKADNSKAHGPGGQFQHDLEEQADPCFGKIVDGMDTFQRIFKLESYPVTDDYAYFLLEPVTIVTATILDLPLEKPELRTPITVPEVAATTDTTLPKKPFHYTKPEVPLNP